MREYIMTMSAAAIVAAVFELLAPKEWDKYVRLGAGLVILTIMLSPIIKLKSGRIEPIPETKNINESVFYDEIAESLKKRIEQDIETRLRGEFGVNAEAEVEIEVDEEHNIKGVKRIRLKTHKKVNKMAERLEEVYGCDTVEINPE